jgi:hypothetical protein
MVTPHVLCAFSLVNHHFDWSSPIFDGETGEIHMFMIIVNPHFHW